MSVSLTVCRELLNRARGGDQAALGELLEHHRPYLKLIAQRMIGPQLAARLDSSDVVQQTCLSAFAKIGEFAGEGADEFAAWLRTIHECNLKNAFRTHIGVQKRSLTREQPLEAKQGEQEWLSAQQSSPSQRLMQSEEAVRLAAALQVLPQEQREAVRLRYLEGLSLIDISERTGKTRHSVAGLIKRGLIRLRSELRAGHE